MVGSDYRAENLISARYPSIEAFSRPWHSQVTYHIQLEVKPISAGRLLLKSVAIDFVILSLVSSSTLSSLVRFLDSLEHCVSMIDIVEDFIQAQKYIVYNF
jgi:hypothetical protein